MDKTNLGTETPVFSASNIHDELADRTQAISAGGIGMIHQVVKSLELDDANNRRLNLFQKLLAWKKKGTGMLAGERVLKTPNVKLRIPAIQLAWRNARASTGGVPKDDEAKIAQRVLAPRASGE